MSAEPDIYWCEGQRLYTFAQEHPTHSSICEAHVLVKPLLKASDLDWSDCAGDVYKFRWNRGERPAHFSPAAALLPGEKP